MTRRPVVMHSIEAPGGDVCVDLIRREDGSFGFVLCRRDAEDPRGWFAHGHHEHGRFSSLEAARTAARAVAPWLGDV